MVGRAILTLLPPTGLLATALALGACDDPIDSPPIGPRPATVLLDTTSVLAGVRGAVDTVEVVVPERRLLGLIMETDQPIVARYGNGPHDVVWSGFGGAFAAVVPQVGTGPVRLFVRRSEPDPVEVHYRIRAIAVDEAPESAPQTIAPGTRFHREWVDPPLDLDVYAIDFEDGDRFFVEMESGDDEVQVTMGLLPPAGASFYVFLATGPERARSDTFQAVVPGEHLFVVYSAGLAPDVELAYRFRVIEADKP